MSALDRLDLYSLKRAFERTNELVDLAGIAADLRFLAHARRALLPLPVIDRPEPVDPNVFPPFESRPAPGLRGKRVAVVASGGGGACIAVVGAARALEEAGVEPELITACSGSAIWGSMWAAGMDAREMAEFSLSWRAEDYLDIQWARLPRFALSALRGFSGLARGKAIEKLFDDRLLGMNAGDTAIPLETVAYDMDRGIVEYLGSLTTPDVSVGELVRIAVALPLFIEAVPVHGHLYVDGGVVELFPAKPVIDDGGFDRVFGLNFMLPHGFEPPDITGWNDKPLGVFTASRQLQQGTYLELARRSRDLLGDSLTLIDPVDPALLYGISFYDLFIDRRRWPEIMRQGYRSMVEALEPFRRAGRRPAARATAAPRSR
jgi:NTE family protein